MEGSLYTGDLLMQKDRQEKLQRNTKVLDSVIDTIYTLGSYMPSRGHRDDSKYYDDKGNNPGNFQVMLEYRARSGDTVLAEHLKRTKENNGGRNCTHRSKTIQNEVIKCFEQELRGIIISEVKQANNNNKKRSHTQLDSRKQVIAFQDRVITINIKEAQHPLKREKQVIDKSSIMLKISTKSMHRVLV